MDKNIRNIIEVWGNRSFDDALGDQEKEFFDIFLKIAISSNRILEIGVGSGRMIKILRENGVKAFFCGVDLTSNVAVAPCNRIIGDARQLPIKSESFDLVYSLGVVEHFPETEQAIYEHSRVTKPNGYVLITTPHVGISTVLRLISFYRKRQYKKGTFEVVRGRNLRLSSVKRMLRNAGLSIVYSQVIGKTFPHKYSRLGSIIDKVFVKKIFGPYLCVIGKKSP